jgi:gliding motility-associated-like protein
MNKITKYFKFLDSKKTCKIKCLLVLLALFSSLQNSIFAQDIDGDGVANTIDLDNDNDGILDADEGGPVCFAGGPSASIKPTAVTLNTLLNAATNTSPVTVNGFANNGFNFTGTLNGANWRASTGTSGTSGFTGGVQVKDDFPAIGHYLYLQPEQATSTTDYAQYQFVFPTAVNNFSMIPAGLNSNDAYEILAFNGATPVVITTANLSNFDTDNSQNWVTSNLGNGVKVVQTGAFGGTSVTENTFRVSIPGTITRIQIRSYKNDGSTSTVTTGITSIGFCSAGPYLDTDGDLTPDYLDVDSDNDGCPDAIEAAGTFVLADLTSSNNLADVNEGSVNSNGVPTNVGSPQAMTPAVLNNLDNSACIFVTSVSSETETEGTSLVHDVALSGAPASDLTVAFTITDNTTASGDRGATTFSNGVVNNGDGTITIPAGVTSFTITVASVDDSTDEPNEFYDISVGGVAATGTINDNDTVTVASVSTEAETEGTSLVHDVVLSGAPASDLTVAFTITDNTTASGDRGATTFSNGVVNNGDGTITIPAGVTSFTITVASVDDSTDEPNEFYDISVGGVAATGTIQDNDNCISNPATDCDGDGVSNGDELSPPGGGTPTDPENPCSYNVAHITLPVTSTQSCLAELKVTKIADANGLDLGDTITYTITIENTGNVTLTNISLDDAFVDVNGNSLALTSGVTFNSADLGSLEGTLIAGESAIYTATFNITQQAINAGGVSNSVVVSGTSPSGAIVNDISDDGDDFDGNNNDDPTITELGCAMVFNEFSPNGDGVNDVLIINCIDNYPDNSLEIYNRWGNIVYKKKGYQNDFDGTSNGRATINTSEKLPVGTYYYILDLGNGSKPKVGWLYINR